MTEEKFNLAYQTTEGYRETRNFIKCLKRSIEHILTPEQDIFNCADFKNMLINLIDAQEKITKEKFEKMFEKI